MCGTLTIGPVRHSNSATWRMLRWATIILVIAIIASAIGFGGNISSGTTGARIVFVIFLLLFVLLLLFGHVGSKKR